MYETICVMAATYKRPAGIQRLIDSALRTADDVHRLRFMFCVNERDKETLDYIESRYWPVPMQYDIVFEDTEQPNLALYYNMMYERVEARDEPWLVSMVGDDMVFVTPGWDTRVLREVNERDGNAIVYLNDDYIAGEKCCVNLFTTRKMVAATRRPFMCPLYHADMIDVVWTDVGNLTGTLVYLKDVVLRHEHESRKLSVTGGESLVDETFRRLQPLRQAYGTENHRQEAYRYAVVNAARIVQAGMGRWNKI